MPLPIFPINTFCNTEFSALKSPVQWMELLELYVLYITISDL